MSVMGMLHQLGGRTLRIQPFQQKRDANADENERPDPTGVDVDHVHTREQQHNSTDQKYWASDGTVKSAISKPVGEAADGHGEKARSR
jgi:hypothetical protein